MDDLAGARTAVSSEQSQCKILQARWFRRSRKALGMDVKSMAQLLDVSPRTINAWENESSDSLPSRNKLFHYLSLLVDRPDLLDPAQLINYSRLVRSKNEDNLSKNRTISFYFSKLNARSKAVVNILVRSLYRTQERLRRRGVKRKMGTERLEKSKAEGRSPTGLT